MSKSYLLAKKYELEYGNLTEMQDKLDLDRLSGKLQQCGNCEINIENYNHINISLIICFKNCIKVRFYSDQAVILLGIDSESYMDYLGIQSTLPDLDVFGNALSEKNRVEILNQMTGKEEITIKDIEQELGFSGTNAYYHLSLMLKANMIRSGNQGRLVLYRINKEYFDVISDMIKKYSSRSNTMKGEKL